MSNDLDKNSTTAGLKQLSEKGEIPKRNGFHVSIQKKKNYGKKNFALNLSSSLCSPFPPFSNVENSLGPRGASHLSTQLMTTASLKHLNLGKNSIGVEGAKELSKMLTVNKSIQKLILSGTTRLFHSRKKNFQFFFFYKKNFPNQKS